MAEQDRTPRIVAIVDGEPFDPLTWSGISHNLLEAIQRRGALAGAANARPSYFDQVEQAASVSLCREVWKQRFWGNSSFLSPALRNAMSSLGARRARTVDAAPDASLQVSVWFDLSRDRRFRPAVRCSYQGGNFPGYLGRPDLALDPESKQVRRTFEYERRVQDSMDLILTKSEWLRRSMIADFGQDPDKVVVVGAGANVKKVPPARERDLSQPRYLFVGKNFERKGGRQLLAAFRRVRAERPDAELWLVGPRESPTDDPGVRHFGRIARNSPEGEAAIDRVYSEATAFVMPSLFEPFGNVFLEAMSYRLPCIGSDCCAMPEIIADGVSGYLAPPGNVDRLAERMLALAAAPERGAEMGEAGHRRFLEHYNWDLVAERMTEAISRKLDSR